ncbi:hypothetical protein ES707_06788 [subsurface metagenome]
MNPPPPLYNFTPYDIFLIRDVNGQDIYLDKQQTASDVTWSWDTVKDVKQFYNRCDTNWNVVYQDLRHNVMTPGSLGNPDPNVPGRRHNFNIPASYTDFVTVGDVARVLFKGPSTEPDDMIGKQLEAEPPEGQVRLNLQNPDFRRIFQYLTVMDPNEHGQSADETRIKGRININTAPWFVIAQLPWMTDEIARAIVAYRDKTDVVYGPNDPNGPDYEGATGRYDVTKIDRIREEWGFESIGELATVINTDPDDPNKAKYEEYDIRHYALDGENQVGFPDLTGDTEPNDFEERNLIFSRISNLVTVRSDVFTAYILVRLGPDGPQKRVVAILDRSNVDLPEDRVKVVVRHLVPDPR